MSSQHRRVFLHNPPMDTPSNQYQSSTIMSKPQCDPSAAQTNADMGYQQTKLPPSSSASQQGWQRHQDQQHLHRMQQQQQELLQLRGQGRGPTHNQPVRPSHDGTQYAPNYQGGKILPPVNLDNQPRSMQLAAVAGTNAVPMQRQFQQHDEYNYSRNSGPTSLDSSLQKQRPPANYTNHPSPERSPLAGARRQEQPQPTQYASEGINEEIRYQADKQRRHQEYERFDSDLKLDPYLICPKCKLQFREGQLPEYRHHIDNCRR